MATSNMGLVVIVGEKWSCGKIGSPGTPAAVVRRLVWCGGYRQASTLKDSTVLSCLPPPKYSVSCSFFVLSSFTLQCSK